MGMAVGTAVAQARADQEAASQWEVHTAPDGRIYYHNEATNLTTWKRPPELDRAAQSPALRAVGVESFGASDGRLVGSGRAKRASISARLDTSEYATMKPKALQKFLRARAVDFDDTVSQEDLVALSARSAHKRKVLWQKAKHADGRIYWFNARTKATTWQEPLEQEYLDD